MPSLRSVAYVLAATCWGCASPNSHLGTWEHQGAKDFARVVLERDGKCTIVFGGLAGGVREGIGGRCRYSQDGRTLLITDIGEIDGRGPTEKLPAPFVLRYDDASDTVSLTGPETSLRLARSAK